MKTYTRFKKKKKERRTLNFKELNSENIKFKNFKREEYLLQHLRI